jgi:glycosyltransferase 2 family protein
VTSESTPGADGRSGRWRRGLVLGARVVFTTAILGAVIYTTSRQWSAVRGTLTSLAWQSVVLSLLLAFAGLGAQTMAWHAALRQVQDGLRVRTSGQIYLIGQLAKYLPGSLWTFVLQMELGRRARILRSRVFVASVVVTALSTTAALILGVFGVRVLVELGGLVTAFVVVLVPVALVCSHPRILTSLMQRLLRLLRRPGLEAPITWSGVGAIVGWSSAGWIILGGHLWVLAGSDAAPGMGGLARCVGAVALGITAGMIAFLSPSGLGVREATITATLLPYMPAGTALAIALASRLILTVAEVLAASVAALSGVRLTRSGTKAVGEPA